MQDTLKWHCINATHRFTNVSRKADCPEPAARASGRSAGAGLRLGEGACREPVRNADQACASQRRPAYLSALRTQSFTLYRAGHRVSLLNESSPRGAMRTIITFLLAIGATTSTYAQERLPIIDMHLHALAADAQGPPPMGMCTPIEPMPAWDPSRAFGETFMAMMKDPPCDDPVWSPMTDEEVMTQTFEVMERLNILGVVSGPSLRRMLRSDSPSSTCISTPLRRTHRGRRRWGCVPRLSRCRRGTRQGPSAKPSWQ